MAAYSQYTILFCSMLCLSALAADKTTATTFPTTTPGSPDGRGIEHCLKCGNGSVIPGGLKASNISRCVLKEANALQINQSLFSCECRRGFDGDGLTCEDFDECLRPEDNSCDNYANCTNTVGSFKCTCKEGFIGDGIGECKDEDECMKVGSAEDARRELCSGVGWCDNIPGTYTCKCDPGYELNTEENDCIDINECAVNNSDCEQQCINLPGTHLCSCYSGYEAKDPSTPGRNCTSINECERLLNPCGRNAFCTDTKDSYYCSCNPGFKWEEDVFKRHCVDIDECGEGLKQCSEKNSKCHNTIGSSTCVCNEGYFGDVSNCQNVNECTAGAANCHPDATCQDKVGNYTCKCNDGYHGDGFKCEDDNECADKSTNDCDENAHCHNTKGTFNCTCIYGYEGNGTSCTVSKYGGTDIKDQAGRISRSQMLVRAHMLDHKRMELELEHEQLLRKCAKEQQKADRKDQLSRGRREIIDIDAKDAQAAEAWVVLLQKTVADLQLANHAMKLACP